MTYKFVCPKCKKSTDVECKAVDYEEVKAMLYCEDCNTQLIRDIADFCSAPVIGGVKGGYGIDGKKGWSV